MSRGVSWARDKPPRILAHDVTSTIFAATDFIFYNYEIWLKDNPAPDQDRSRRYGGYPNIPWPQWDAAM